MNVLGTFSKGVEGSISINWSESGGENCSDRCKMKGAGCYAETSEAMRPNIKQSGIKKRKLGPVQLANMAIVKLRMIRSPWIRFSVFGSLPMPGQAEKSKGFKKAFQNLILESLKTGAKLHIPAETKAKAEFYQNWVNEVAPEVVVRESCQTESGVLASKIPNSFVVGENGDKKAEKLESAKKLIDKLRKQGKSVVSCPAIVRNSKCGKCTACSDSRVDTVVYLKH